MYKKNVNVENKVSDDNGLVTATVVNTKIGEVKNKIPDVSGLASTVVLNTKIGALENKIPDVSGLVKKAVYDAKISDTKGKYFATSDYNKFMSDILCAKIFKNWSINLIFSNLLRNYNLNAKLKTVTKQNN